MSSNDKSLFGLAPLSSEQGFGSQSLSAFNSGDDLSPDQVKMVAEFRKQLAIMEATGIKVDYGVSKIAEMNQYGATTFDSTAGFLFDLKAQSRSKEHQEYVNEFTQRQLSMLGKHILGAIAVGSQQIATEMGRSLYFATEEERRGFWQRVFGK